MVDGATALAKQRSHAAGDFLVGYKTAEVPDAPVNERLVTHPSLQAGRPVACSRGFSRLRSCRLAGPWAQIWGHVAGQNRRTGASSRVGDPLGADPQAK